ncbi:MAG: hypothetical protein AAGB51_08430 [Planctomycetota bacterium]
MTETEPSPELEQDRAAFRALRTGVLVTEQAARAVKFVFDPRTGHLVLTLPAAALREGQAVLSAPDEADDAFQALVRLDETDESGHGPAIDRWRAAHGEPRGELFISAEVEAVKRPGEVHDGERFCEANMLLDDEPRLLRELNADREALARATGDEALAVGVDQFGLDIRLAFGVKRLQFPERASDASHARQMITDALSGAEA